VIPINNSKWIALKEARQTCVRLQILATATVVARGKLDPLIGEADELKRILAAIIISTKRGGSSDDWK
jgi:hypothetical protein